MNEEHKGGDPLLHQAVAQIYWKGINLNLFFNQVSVCIWTTFIKSIPAHFTNDFL